ncbi:MAG TPA: hypothetical protein VKS60_14070 [Stellaceae bacterium]|nr:hypothetical protein [Stellaceae bacterium]
MRRFASLIVVLCLGVASLLGNATTAAAQSGSPFIMVVNSDPGTTNDYFTVLNTYALPMDYFGARLINADTGLGVLVGQQHTIATPSTLANVRHRANTGCVPDVANMIIYEAADVDSPSGELSALAHSVSAASGYVANSPNTCHAFGTSFGPEYIGINIGRCSYSSTYISNNQYNDYVGSNIFAPSMDWSGVSLIVLQAQQLLNDGTASPSHATKCASPSKIAYVDTYVLALQDMVARLRMAAPNALIATQLSFRFTNPSSMVSVMTQLTGSGGVDGFYLTYPISSGQACTYCTPADLQTVLSALRPS